MLAKVYHHKGYANGDKIETEGASKVSKPEPYFKTLQEQFSGTKYYQEILKECGYFKTYVTSTKKK